MFCLMTSPCRRSAGTIFQRGRGSRSQINLHHAPWYAGFFIPPCAHNMSQYLRYAVYECRHVVSNELQLRQVVTAITLTPVRHKHHMQIFFKYLTSAPNFMGGGVSRPSPDPAFPSPRPSNSKRWRVKKHFSFKSLAKLYLPPHRNRGATNRTVYLTFRWLVMPNVYYVSK